MTLQLCLCMVAVIPVCIRMMISLHQDSALKQEIYPSLVKVSYWYVKLPWVVGLGDTSGFEKLSNKGGACALYMTILGRTKLCFLLNLDIEILKFLFRWSGVWTLWKYLEWYTMSQNRKWLNKWKLESLQRNLPAQTQLHCHQLQSVWLHTTCLSYSYPLSHIETGELCGIQHWATERWAML